MKIVNEIIDEGAYLTILKADYQENYRLQLFFSNGKNLIIDFEPFISNSYHHGIRKYLDKDQFRKFKIVNGNLNWNDYDLIFPIEDLYLGNLNPGIEKTARVSITR